VPTLLKFGSLNLLEPSGPVQACNGIALPLQTYNNREKHVSKVRSASKKSADGVSKTSVITLSGERKDWQQRETAVFEKFLFPEGVGSQKNIFWRILHEARLRISS
jgi:hypothetical protein